MTLFKSKTKKVQGPSQERSILNVEKLFTKIIFIRAIICKKIVCILKQDIKILILVKILMIIIIIQFKLNKIRKVKILFKIILRKKI